MAKRKAKTNGKAHLLELLILPPEGLDSAEAAREFLLSERGSRLFELVREAGAPAPGINESERELAGCAADWILDDLEMLLRVALGAETRRSAGRLSVDVQHASAVHFLQALARVLMFDDTASMEIARPLFDLIDYHQKVIDEEREQKRLEWFNSPEQVEQRRQALLRTAREIEADVEKMAAAEVRP